MIKNEPQTSVRQGSRKIVTNHTIHGFTHLLLIIVIIFAGVGTVGYLAYQNNQLKKEVAQNTNKTQLLPTPKTTKTPIECDSCPQFTPPGPNWCKDGIIIKGEMDKCGCQGPPKCDYSNWKTHSTSTYTFKYPPNVELKEMEASIAVLNKWGPTQKADTEFYDGISLRFQPFEIPQTTLKDYVQAQIGEIEMAGIAKVISGPSPIAISNYSGLTYVTEGLGTFKTIVIQTDNGVMFMEITDSTVDPQNLGFVETVNQILSTFKFSE